MRPITLQRLLLQCGILALILFAVVVVALKLGAVPVSLYGLGRDLISVLLRQTSQLSSENPLAPHSPRNCRWCVSLRRRH